MAIAVSVLMILIAVAFFINSAVNLGRDWISNLGLVITAGLGVLNIAPGWLGFQIATGVVVCILALISIALFIKACMELGGGRSNSGLAVAACFGAFLLMALLITFAVLQLTIVV